jgi:hypothetical protein
MPNALVDLKVPRRRGEIVAPGIRHFLFGFFFGVFWGSTVSTRRHLMGWLDGAQASHRAVELRPGRKQAVWMAGLAGRKGGGPETGGRTAEVVAKQSCVQSAVGADRRLRSDSAELLE